MCNNICEVKWNEISFVYVIKKFFETVKSNFVTDITEVVRMGLIASIVKFETLRFMFENSVQWNSMFWFVAFVQNSDNSLMRYGRTRRLDLLFFYTIVNKQSNKQKPHHEHFLSVHHFVPLPKWLSEMSKTTFILIWKLSRMKLWT